MSSDVYSLLVFVHILAATVLLATSLFEPLTRSALRRASTNGDALTWLAFQRRITRLNPLAALVVLASGVYLGTVGWTSQAWFQLAIVLFVANSLAASIVIKRLDTRLAQHLAGTPTHPLSRPADDARWSAAWDLTGAFLLANDLVLLLLMVRKPALGASLAILVAFHAAAALAAVLLRRPAQPLVARREDVRVEPPLA